MKASLTYLRSKQQVALPIMADILQKEFVAVASLLIEFEILVVLVWLSWPYGLSSVVHHSRQVRSGHHRDIIARKLAAHLLLGYLSCGHNQLLDGPLLWLEIEK